MPRYDYKCLVCEKKLVLNHLSDEVEKDCSLCGEAESLIKLLSSFTTNRDIAGKKQRVGDITEQFIKDARKDLQQQKESE